MNRRRFGQVGHLLDPVQQVDVRAQRGRGITFNCFLNASRTHLHAPIVIIEWQLDSVLESNDYITARGISKSADASLKGMDSIAVGNAHGSRGKHVHSTLKGSQTDRDSTLSGSEFVVDSNPVALPPAIEFVRLAD